MSSSSDPPYRFGDFELTTRPFRLTRLGESGEVLEEVSLQPQPARALELLAENAGELVTREALREHLWGLEAHLDHEQAINFTIRKVRAALGDSAQSPRYVETLPRQGYRLVTPVERGSSRPATPPPPVEDEPSSTPPAATPSAARSPAARVALFASIVAVVLVSALSISGFWDGSRPGNRTATILDEPQSEALWRARVLIDRGDAESVAAAREILENLVVESPDSAEVALAMARLWMADGALQKPYGKAFDQYWPEVERWADRARSLDPSLVDAHVLAANARFYLRRDWEATRRILEEEALAREPNHPRALHVYGLYLASVGRFDAAIDTIRRAVAADPENLYIHSDLALTYLLARRFDEAITQARQNLEVGSPGDEAWWMMLSASDLAGRPEAADATAIEAMRALFDIEVEGLDEVRPWAYEILSRQVAENSDPRLPALARWAVQVGETDRAIDLLVEACAGPGDWDRPYLAVHPRFDELREHPRWSELADCLAPIER